MKRPAKKKLAKTLTFKKGKLKFGTSAVFASLQIKPTRRITKIKNTEDSIIGKLSLTTRFDDFVKENFTKKNILVTGSLLALMIFGVAITPSLIKKQVPQSTIAESSQLQLTHPIAKINSKDKVAWISTLSTKNLKENQKYLSLPKNTKNINLKVFNSQKEAVRLLQLR